MTDSNTSNKSFISNEDVRIIVDELVRKLRTKGDGYATGYLSQLLYFNIAYNLSDEKKAEELKHLVYAIAER